MNYKIAIEKFQELRDKLRKELEEGQKKIDVTFKEEYYTQTKNFIGTFFIVPENQNLRKRVRENQKTNKFYNNTTKIESLIDLLNTIILDLTTRFEVEEKAQNKEVRIKPIINVTDQIGKVEYVDVNPKPIEKVDVDKTKPEPLSKTRIVEGIIIGIILLVIGTVVTILMGMIIR
jgi:hypothetical protein